MTLTKNTHESQHVVAKKYWATKLQSGCHRGQHAIRSCQCCQSGGVPCRTLQDTVCRRRAWESCGILTDFDLLQVRVLAMQSTPILAEY